MCHVMPSIVCLARLTGRLTGSCMEWGEVADRLSRRSPGGFSSPSPDSLVSLLCCHSASLCFCCQVADVDVFSGGVLCIIHFYSNASVIEF